MQWLPQFAPENSAAVVGWLTPVDAVQNTQTYKEYGDLFRNACGYMTAEKQQTTERRSSHVVCRQSLDTLDPTFDLFMRGDLHICCSLVQLLLDDASTSLHE